ncbi:MAG: hypothetical protein HY865_18155 [Chloroflexi bacterium]|nr:hypothetical protein [Chloroflexota bacterium]
MKFSVKKGILSSITLMWMVASCFAPDTTLPPTGTPFPEVIPATPTGSPTAEQPTPASQDQPVELSLEAGCIPIEDEIPADLSFSGSWIRNDEAPYLEYLNEGSTYTVPLEGKGLFSTDKDDFAISPDGKYLAYIDKYIDPVRHDMEKRILRIIKSSGHVLSMNYWAVDWQWIIGWVDNQHLALSIGKEVAVLNPFTGEWKKFESPKWLSEDSKYYSFPYIYVDTPRYSYAPTLNWLLLETDHRTLEVRDMQSGELIWNVDGYVEPVWSGDGSTLALMTTESIALITKEGRTSKFHIPDMDINYFHNTGISPNGQKLISSSSYPDEIFIFDFDERKISKVCNRGYSAGWYPSLPPWSPDSRFVVQSIRDSHYDPFDLLVDTQQMRAYKLVSGEFQHRLVWLAPP